MDPKALSHLDPKARETYDRVMGTAASMESPADAAPAPNDPMTPTPTAPDSGFVPLTPIDTSGGMAEQVTPAPTTDANFSSGPADLTMAGAAAPGEVVNTDATFNTPGAVSGPTDMAQTPVDLSAPIMTDLSQPVADPAQASQPSIFSANPVSADSQNAASSSFFTNPAPDTTESTAPAPSFDPNPVTPQETSFGAPADTAMATDSMSPLTPVTPYTPSGLNDTQASAIAVDQPFNQPLQSPAAAVNQTAPHQSSALLKVLYIVAAVVFFAIYTIFWIKVFNLPFLF